MPIRGIVELGGRKSDHRLAGWRRVALAAVLGATAAACSRGDAAPRGVPVVVREHDFALTANVSRVHAGLVTFRVSNAGPSTHEFNVDRTALAPDALPRDPSGLGVNENSKLVESVATVGEIRLGATRDLTLDLKPGHYVLYCNLSGHYLGGMYVGIDVVA